MVASRFFALNRRRLLALASHTAGALLAFRSVPGADLTTARAPLVDLDQSVSLGPYLISIQPAGPVEEILREAGRRLRSRFLDELAERDLSWTVVSSRWLEGDLTKGEPGRFEVLLYNPLQREGARVSGGGTGLDGLSIDFLPDWQPRPSADEFNAAVGVLQESRPDLLEGVSIYRPMPPISQRIDGPSARILNVGLRQADGGPVRHRTVGIDLDERSVEVDPAGAPGPSASDCGPLTADECSASAGSTHWRVEVRREGTLLWSFSAVRPSASSGLNGSGVELGNVSYLGQPVLRHANVPIMNVLYDENDQQCGPSYRDWFDEEACFEAIGDDVHGGGFRVCSGRPLTIVDGGVDGGSFRGIALFVEDDEVVLMSETQAGWYRYVSQWRLAPEGTIKPRLAFGATSNPCTCVGHTHHAYWRFDFALEERNERVTEVDDRGARAVETETPILRDAVAGREWSVEGTSALRKVDVVPGPLDGSADEFGKADGWIVQKRPGEWDDRQGFTNDPSTGAAHIDEFVNGGSLTSTDVVFWYGVHHPHREPGDDGPHDHATYHGPDLRLADEADDGEGR